MPAATPLPLELPAATRRTRPQRAHAGQRTVDPLQRRTSLMLHHEDEVLLDRLQDAGDYAGIGAVLRAGLRALAEREGIDLDEVAVA